MQISVNYPKTEEDIKIFSNNLATFKAKLLLKSIENLNIDNKAKNEVLNKIFEILDNKPNSSII